MKPNIPKSLITDNRITQYNQLIVYSESGHMIQTFTGSTRTIPLLKSVDISSIVVIDDTGSVLPFSYIPETNLGVSLINRSTGEKVSVNVTKNMETITGRVLSLSKEDVTLMVNNTVVIIRNYDRIAINSNEDNSYPSITLLKSSRKFTLSYLFSDILWYCVGTALIDIQQERLYLRLAGNINNNTDNDITGNVSLVSGNVHQQKRYNVPEAMTLTSRKNEAPMKIKKVVSSQVEDYIKYPIGNRTIHNKDVVELGVWEMAIIKIYVHMTNDDDRVTFGYRFPAPNYIPQCMVNAYSMNDNNEIGAYIGSDNIDESQKGDNIDIILGETTVLQCKDTITTENFTIKDETTARKYGIPMTLYNENKGKGIEFNIIVESLLVEINNTNKIKSYLIIKHYVGNRNLINVQCKDYIKREDGYIEWYFEINQSDTFRCQIIMN
jgi:hypothetical protein